MIGLDGRVEFPGKFPAFQLHDDTVAIRYGRRLLCTGTQVKIDELSINRHPGLRFPHGMTTEIIRPWSSCLKKHDQEKSVGDTSRFAEESNRLCRPVAMDFVSS